MILIYVYVQIHYKHHGKMNKTPNESILMVSDSDSILISGVVGYFSIRGGATR